MLRLDLARLGREGSVQIEARIAPDDALLEGLEASFDGPLEVRLRAATAGSGEIVVRGRVEGSLRQQCRRCLKDVQGRLHEELTLVFEPSGAPEEDDGDVRTFDERAGELDLSGPVREELILAIDPYVVCDPECKGLCPRCGADLNVETCDCTDEELDPRWETLRALRKE